MLLPAVPILDYCDAEAVRAYSKQLTLTSLGNQGYSPTSINFLTFDP